MSVHPFDLSGVMSRQGEESERNAALLLWTAASSFASKRGGDEFTFADTAIRLYASAFMRLDPKAARDYLVALADRLDPDLTLEEQLAAEGSRREAWMRLRASLALQAEPAAGTS